MSYEINSNTYNTQRAVQTYDIFNKDKISIGKGTEIDSVLTFQIIVDEADQVDFKSLSPEQCLAKKVELGYVELVV